MTEAQIQLQNALTTTFLANLAFLSEYDNELYHRVDELSRMIENGSYKEKYALEFIMESGDFDIYDIINNKYLYEKEPKKINDELIKKVKFDQTNSIFYVPEYFTFRNKVELDLENRFYYEYMEEFIALTQNDMVTYASLLNDFVHKKKKKLKEITTLDVRKISKLNLLAIYGAIKTLKDKEYKKDLSLYAASNFACIQETYKILQELKSENPVMPFDFLNINTNNMGFYISKALNTMGNNYTISSDYLSFEKTLYTIFLEYKNRVNSSFLVGEVDSSLENLPYLGDLYAFENNISNDISSWIYFDDISNNSIAKLEFVKYFYSIDDLNNFLKTQKYDAISLNSFATKFKDELNIDKSLIKTYQNFFSSSNIINLLNDEFKNSIFISLDNKKRAYLFYFTK